MEITNKFKLKDYYVYEGLCNEIPTKWITKSEWDEKININFSSTGIIYTDSYGDEIIVLEEDDEDWNIFVDCKFKPTNNCNCLRIDYPNKEKYIDYISDKFDIKDMLLHTLHLSSREQLRGYIKHNYNFDINDLD